MTIQWDRVWARGSSRRQHPETFTKGGALIDEGGFIFAFEGFEDEGP